MVMVVLLGLLMMMRLVVGVVVMRMLVMLRVLLMMGHVLLVLLLLLLRMVLLVVVVLQRRGDNPRRRLRLVLLLLLLLVCALELRSALHHVGEPVLRLCAVGIGGLARGVVGLRGVHVEARQWREGRGLQVELDPPIVLRAAAAVAAGRPRRLSNRR
jgi:hypothetical protein